MCSDAIVSQVLDELGLNMSDELSRKEKQRMNISHVFLVVLAFLQHSVFSSDLPTPGGNLSVAGGKKVEPQAALADADADLEERLNNLRRD